MNRNIKKTILISVITITILFLIVSLIVCTSFYISAKNNFDASKISDNNLIINFFDKENALIRENNQFNNYKIKVSSLPDYVPQSFISIEDKNYYTHKGLSYKRMIKAMLNNIKAGKIKEGASTISQQLIKNTHLSSEKTYTRKLNEIFLTKQLENKFSKNEILECYLNVIYFGNNCYGIENASQYYFSKHAKDLTIDESAMFAGMIKSPHTYSPITNKSKCIERRNLVLRQMYKDKKISYKQLETNTIKDIVLNISKQKNDIINTYTQSALKEAIQILKIPARQIAINKIKIYTNYDSIKQQMLEESIQTNNPTCDYACVNINAKTGNIDAFCARSDYSVIDNLRQPGSAIKPILVYAPALEEGKIYPCTKILDEPININNYKPSNIGNVFHGYVDINESVCKSLNIPAIKVMNYLGIEKAKQYAEKCGIKFDEKDQGYALALGGMTYGTNVVELTNSYIPFCNNGKFTKASFINYITDSKGKILYINEQKNNQVFRDDTTYLMNKMLIDSCKNGTSKALLNNFEIASKSGTVGKGKTTYDAWNIAYTTSDLTGVWLGNMTNEPITYVGGTMPAYIIKSFQNSIYNKAPPKNFDKPSSIVDINIDLIELNDNHRVVKANQYIPQKYIKQEQFSRFYQPEEKSSNFISIKRPQISGSINGKNAIVSFDAEEYLTYELYKIINGKKQLEQIITNKNGHVNISIPIIQNKIVGFYIVPKLKNFTNNTEIVGEDSNLIELINTSNSNTIINNDKKKNKWYI